MNCCEPTILTFNDNITRISYSEGMAQKYGSEPNVQVYYLEDGNYVVSNDMNRVSFDGSAITVDHGGVNVGIIKIF